MKSTYAQTINEAQLDPRVVRTRHQLLDAFDALLNENGALRNISIQNITDRAKVNRITFYAHFADKYELLAFWKRDIFRQEVAKRQPDIEAVTVEQLIDVVLDFMLHCQQKRRQVNQQFEPLVEAAIQKEIQEMLLRIICVEEDVAVFLAWAIFGSAREWSYAQERLPQEAVVDQLLRLVNKIVRS